MAASTEAQDALPFPTTTVSPTPRDKRPSNDAKRSIRYMAEVALRYGKVGGLTELLDRVASFEQYKPFQALLVLLQRPAATYVLPAHHWEERLGWVVRPQEQPLVLLQPQGPVMFMFDVSQVEPGPHAKSLPAFLRNPYAMKDLDEGATALHHVVANAKLDGVRVSDAGLGLGFAGCARRAATGATQTTRGLKLADPPLEVPVRFEVLVNRSYNATEQLATLAHELGHIYCGHLGEQKSDVWPGQSFWKDRQVLPRDMQELEAESVARVVFKRLAPDVELPEHLSQYFDREPELDGVDLEPILTSAGRVLEMTQGFKPRRPR